MKEKQKNMKRASILGMAIVIMILLVMAGLAMLILGYNSRVRAMHHTGVNAARCAADSGLKECIYLMNKRLDDHLPLDAAGLEAIAAGERTLEGCTATYTLELSGSTSAGFDATATGTAGTDERPIVRKVHATLARKTYWWGIGVQSTVDLKNSSVVTTLPGGTSLEIRTNSTDKFAISLNTSVTGDIVFGPDGNGGTVVKLLPGSSVSGSIYPAEETLEFPPVDPPTGLPNQTYSPGVPLATGVYNNLTISGNADTTSGDVTIYVKGKVILMEGATLTVPTDGSLKLYLGTSFEGKTNSNLVNSTLDATKMRIYGLPTCDSIIVKNSADFYGAIYAPDADIIMHNTGAIVGALIGNSLVIDNGAAFYYDMRLATIEDPEAMFIRLVRWWEE